MKSPQHLGMMRIDAGILVLYLLRAICTRIIELLNCVLVKYLCFKGGVETGIYRFIMWLGVFGVLKALKLFKVLPKLHIVWAWIVLVGGAPWSIGDTKTATALVMLIALLVALALTKIFDAFSDRATVQRIISFIEDNSPRLNPARSPLSVIERKCWQLLAFIILKGLIVLSGSDLKDLEMAVMIVIVFIVVLISLRCETDHNAFLIVSIGWTVVIACCLPSGPFTDDRGREMLLIF
jgi:hypothetical protein